MCVAHPFARLLTSASTTRVMKRISGGGKEDLKSGGHKGE